MYAAIAVVFVTLAGLLLHPLLDGPNAVIRFYRFFVPGFLGYAFFWSACWFWLGAGLGEWLGAFVGGIALVTVCARSLGMGTTRSFGLALAGFLLFHMAGYYAGGWSMHRLLILVKNWELSGFSRAQGINLAKWSWGLGYGLGFGAGLGWILDCFSSSQPALRRLQPELRNRGNHLKTR
jgi:hypothetical protein